MDWIKIGHKVPKINNNQLVVIAQFYQGMSVVVRSFVGTWEEVKSVKTYELHNLYTHYMLVNNPNF